MATSFTVAITPDASLNITPMAFTVGLDDPADFQVFMTAYSSILKLDDASTPEQIMAAWLSSVMQGSLNNVVSWVHERKILNVTTTAPTLSIS